MKNKSVFSLLPYKLDVTKSYSNNKQTLKHSLRVALNFFEVVPGYGNRLLSVYFTEHNHYYAIIDSKAFWVYLRYF